MNGLVQDCSNSSALAMELLQSCSKPPSSYFELKKYTIKLTFAGESWGVFCQYFEVTDCLMTELATQTTNKIFNQMLDSIRIWLFTLSLKILMIIKSDDNEILVLIGPASFKQQQRKFPFNLELN